MRQMITRNCRFIVRVGRAGWTLNSSSNIFRLCGASQKCHYCDIRCVLLFGTILVVGMGSRRLKCIIFRLPLRSHYLCAISPPGTCFGLGFTLVFAVVFTMTSLRSASEAMIGRHLTLSALFCPMLQALTFCESSQIHLDALSGSKSQDETFKLYRETNCPPYRNEESSAPLFSSPYRHGIR